MSVAALTTGGDTLEGRAESTEDTHEAGEESNSESEAKIKLVIDCGSFKCWNFPAQQTGNVEYVQECHFRLDLRK